MNIRAIAGICACVVLGCSAAPVSPERLTGTWIGRYHQLSCTTTLSSNRICESATTGEITLLLEQRRGQLSGEITFRSGGAFLVSRLDESPFPVIGSVKGVEARLTGSEIASTPNGGTRIADLQDWRMAPADDGVFEGTATWTVFTASKFGSSTTIRILRVTDLMRGA